MSGVIPGLSPLPQAPTAIAPAGLTADGAARVAWQPNVFAWVAVWRLVVVVLGLAAVALPGATSPDVTTLAAALAGAALAGVLGARGPLQAARRVALVVDLALVVGLMALAPDQPTFALMALYSYSAVVSWAAGRPIDAFVAGGICAGAYVVLGLLGPYADSRPAAFVGNLSLYCFFAMATSGFFTVVRRIAALEIATEISRERGRYRRDLHDRLGQALCGLHFELQAVHAIGADAGAPGRLRSLADGYRDAQSMLRDLFRQGDEPMVATNVAAVMQQEARRLAQQSGARIDVSVDGDSTRVPPWMRPHVCAIAGECMTNALKNGEAGGIDIDLQVADGLLVLSVTDDGVGFDNPPGTLPDKVGHYGLREMSERARLCGGEVVVASQVGFGTRVRLQVPLPVGTATDDIIERDASTLRRNVWSLVTVLRTALGAVALLQLVLAESVPAAWRLALGTLIAIDLAAWALRPDAAFRLLAQRPRLLWAHVGGYVAVTAAVTMAGLVPYFMLYAPLVLLAAGIHRGRVLAARLTAAWAVGTLAVAALATVLGRLDGPAADIALLHLTNTVIIGLSAVQGSTLLDRLETLQIRVRYQTLARLRQGLSNRMRDELVERLDTLERTARELATEPHADDDFSQATARLQDGSSELKAKLREIVHQLADPTPGRTPAHV